MAAKAVSKAKVKAGMKKAATSTRHGNADSRRRRGR